MGDSLVNGHINGHISALKDWDRDNGDLLSRSFVVDVVRTKEDLLAQQDCFDDGKITVGGDHSKPFVLQCLETEKAVEITGTYHLSNLLQELSLAEQAGQSKTAIEGSLIAESPVSRIYRRITDHFWKSLTRRMDESSIGVVALDTKVSGEDPRLRIYVPQTEAKQFHYYTKLAEQYPKLRLDVQYLPTDYLDPIQSRKLRAKPGILALQMDWKKSVPRGLRYVVPGGRFNELYGWDSYFICLGLQKTERVELTRDVVHHFIFMINNYGAVLNANRTYYLGRAHPPFLTDLVLRTYAAMDEGEETEEFLRKGILAAIKEYHQVWVSQPRYDPVTGLSRYRPGNHGIPPEVEEGHYDWLLRPHADRANMTVDELTEGYVNGSINNSALDDFYAHDWAVRESGHDTSYRLENICADLATIDLNSLLYKYETDIAWTITTSLDQNFAVLSEFLPSGIDATSVGTADYWDQRASDRKMSVNNYLWNSQTSRFHDYDTKNQSQTPYESITTFWALWSGLASQGQADLMVKITLPQFEHIGGVVSTTPQPHQLPGIDKRSRQWDYPFGWAPHQMMLWEGLRRYGFHEDAKRLAYKWLYLITSIAVNYNGMVLERYDVTKLYWMPGKDAEYENQGSNFRGVPMEGFGWTNASYVCGLLLLDEKLLSNLKKGIAWEDIPIE